MDVDDREPSPLIVDDGGEHARPRKRTRRACDKCSSSRTRCDGEYPCRRCKDYGYTCRYNREIKKRGRVPHSAAVKSASTAAGQLNGTNNHQQYTGETSPSSSATSPPMTSHFPHRPDRHRDSDASSSTRHDDAVPVLSTTQTASHLPSQGFGNQAHLQVATLLDAATEGLPRSHESPSQVTAISDGSASYPSPGTVNGLGNHGLTAPRDTFGSTATGPGRGSFGTVGTESPLHTIQPISGFHKAPSSDCRYRCLDPVLPYLRDIIPASVACDLLDVYLTEPGSSLFRCASPYVLTRIFRKKSLLHSTHPRPTTPALLATMLWCAAQTADIVLLHVPGSRSKITDALYALSTTLISERDPDRWRRIHGGLTEERSQEHFGYLSNLPTTTTTNEPAGVIDDVLTFILLAIVVSGGDFKSDCKKWWSKAVRLVLSMRLNREDERCPASVPPCANPLCSCRRDEDPSLASAEHREERRRVFWLLYCLDRHLALSGNYVPHLPDSYCDVFAPLPETVWENLDTIAAKELPTRVLCPPTTISGTGYFEYFLPLMAILGDIIEIHHRRHHPRLGSLDDTAAVAITTDLLTACETSLASLSLTQDTDPPALNDPNPPPSTSRSSRLKLVTAYSTHILHVLHVLLHGKWDALSMLDDNDDWITSPRFEQCAGHAIAASQAVSQILTFDPELTFMPYLFGIYLLHGSFILLLFADRMPQLGPNQSVEQACETIIRAHEVCVVTLSTEFQKNFRKVLRSTLYSVRGSSPTEWEEHKARRRALSLYRWTKGAKGLAL